ncbi:unnamed protein product [Paramecium sonneborni]|uniref:Uncharacterized protein n=1 Tax=Paramecium sonneborni TaxID=65129 RepID=A0A8S1MNZ7_9CILI|nr:unnamed protein product [Paramecium sonneborni]
MQTEISLQQSRDQLITGRSKKTAYENCLNFCAWILCCCFPYPYELESQGILDCFKNLDVLKNNYLLMLRLNNNGGYEVTFLISQQISYFNKRQHNI